MHPAQKSQQTLFRVASVICVLLAVILVVIPFPGILTLLKFAIIGVLVFAAWMYYQMQKK